jgi:hypothetical protein
MSKSFEPRFLCSKIHSSLHFCIPKFCAIIWELFSKYFYHQNPFIQFYFNPENQLKFIFFYSFGFQPEQGIRLGLLPPFPAQPRPTSSLPPFFSPSGPTGHLSVGALQVYVSRFRKRKVPKAAFAFFFPEKLHPPPPRDRTPTCPPMPSGHLLRTGPDASRPPPPFPSLNRRRLLFASPS